MSRKKVIKIICIISGLFLIFDGIFAGLTANFTMGVIFEIIIGIMCQGIALLRIKRKFKYIAAAGIAVIFCCCVSVWLYGMNDTADYNEKVLIVLGAGVRGKTPTAPLVKRLDTAAEYLEKNKEAYVIVSGGRGPQEDITEAEAMSDYLLSKGIAEERIIKEDKAASTYENFLYSKKIIEERFKDVSVASITNDFHIYRSKIIAQLAGIDTATLHAKTPMNGRISMYLRELAAIVKLWIFKC
ncbi:MAG: YdcF family protein [Clostridia bacterium]